MGKIIERLFRILTELDARESGGNCVCRELTGTSWIELCDEAIELLKELRD